MSKGPGRVQRAVAAELAKLRDNGEALMVGDICRAVFGACEKKHRVSVLRALPYALAQNPHIQRNQPTLGDLRLRIDWHKRKAWRRRMIHEGRW